MKDDAAWGCLFMTVVLTAWAALLFFVARYLFGLVATYLSLADFEVAVLSGVVAIVGAIAAAATLLAD